MSIGKGLGVIGICGLGAYVMHLEGVATGFGLTCALLIMVCIKD